MIRFNWQRSSDAAPMTQMRITYRVTGADVALALGIAAADDGVAPSKISRRRVERELRALLHSNGSPENWPELEDVDYMDCATALNELWPGAVRIPEVPFCDRTGEGS